MEHKLLFVISVMCAFIYYLVKSDKALHILQQNWYNDGFRYLKWIKDNLGKVFINIDILFVIFFIGKYLSEKFIIFLFIIFYGVCALIFVKKRKKEQVKKPLAYTSRVKRLIFTEILLFIALITVLTILISEENFYKLYLILGLFIYLDYIVIFIVNLINKPVEKLVYYYYFNKAKNKLASLNTLDVIGITGSYGKTSSKNILNDILSIKYDVLPTPKNFNTPNGLMITINNYLDKFTKLFIAEMGAFKQGEIKELCDFVHPKYGIITKIGTAHLESFGSQENIQKGKFELIESLPSGGVGVLNADDELQVSYKLKNNCKILWVGIDSEDVDVKASNIKMTYQGMTFDVIFKGDKTKYNFETKLLGKNNIYNILAGLALGKYLGISVSQLQMGVKRVKAVEHRLELKKFGSINIIDDAYNSNPVGSKMAVDVLGLMPGKKIIVTPGMIELGDKQYEYNNTFGKQIADVCDEVILVGKEQTKPIYDGLVEKKFDEKHIYVINDVKLAFKLMKDLEDGETYVLLENDLPDIFNEK